VTPRQLRTAHKTRLRQRAAKLERVTADAVAARDTALIEAHGPKALGGLSYDEMAQAVGLSKGRVIQIVQGKSAYSKAQLAAKEA
jgi:hypothetical protein